MFVKPVVVVVSALLSSASAHADEAPPVRALLADPAQLASWLRDRDPVIESARDRVIAADAASEQTHVLPNPQVQAAAGGFAIGVPNPMTPTLSLAETTNYQIGVGELVELGKRGPRQSAAALRSREAAQTAVGALGQRLGDATAALGRLAYDAAKRDVVAANVDAAKQVEQLEKARLDRKDLSEAEYARIELDTEELGLQLGRAEAELQSALATCSATLYARCTANGLDARSLDAAAPLPAQLPAADQAISGRPAREASRLEAQALGWDATLAEHRKIPDPTIGAAYLFDNLTAAGNLHRQVIVSLAFPLPFFDRGNHDADAARANAHAVEAQDRAEIAQAHGTVEALLAQRDTLERTLKKLETDEVPKSTQIISQTRTAFDLGQARLADLLLAERQHRDLLLEVLDTRYDLFNVRAQLRQALGFDDDVARAIGGKPR